MTPAQRTDTHRWSAADPADYEEVGYMDLHPEEGGCWIDKEASGHSEFIGNFVNRGRCDHCGAGPLRYVVVFLHSSSGELVFVGTHCAARLALTSKSELQMKKEIERRRIAAQVERWKLRNPEAAEYLAAQAGGRSNFLNDLWQKLHKYGSLSERQTEAILRSQEREAQWAAERAERQAREREQLKDAPELENGRRELLGEVLSVKWKDSDFGGAYKMLVRLDDGNKVWGTVPQALFDLVDRSSYRIDRPSMPGPDVVIVYEDEEGWLVADPEAPSREQALKGQRVIFTAAVERSRDDVHFGFYKRPASPRLEEPNLLTPAERS